MPNRDSVVFALTLMSATAILVSIAAAQTLLAMACLAAILRRPQPMVWPSYVIPLCAFMLTTVLALLMSPQPEVGMSAVRKFVLFTMGLLAANLVTSPWRARVRLAHCSRWERARQYMRLVNSQFDTFSSVQHRLLSMIRQCWPGSRVSWAIG